MRRSALFLGGLFLATGASLALAGPAQASDSKCWKDHYGYGQVTYVHTHEVGYGHGHGYGGGYGGFGNGNTAQLGLVNIDIL